MQEEYGTSRDGTERGWAEDAIWNFVCEISGIRDHILYDSHSFREDIILKRVKTQLFSIFRTQKSNLVCINWRVLTGFLILFWNLKFSSME